MDWLKDPIWQFVGVAIGAVALLIPLWIYWLQRSKKSIQYYFQSTALLTSADDRIRLLHQGIPVTDVHLCEFGIRNSGNVAINPSDFLTPIDFTFGENSRVLTAQVDVSRPRDLGAQVSLNIVADQAPTSSHVSLQALLLNPGDALAVKCLVAGFSRFAVGGRVAGVSEFERENKEFVFHLVSWLFGMYIGSLGASFLGVYALLVWQRKVGWAYLAVPLAILAVFALTRAAVGKQLRRPNNIRKAWKLPSKEGM